jgi:hypothetical protein
MISDSLYGLLILVSGSGFTSRFLEPGTIKTPPASGYPLKAGQS